VGGIVSKQLNDLYSTPNNVLLIISRNMGLAGHVTYRGSGEMPAGFCG
jgi:hypothetical protein